MSAPHVLPPVHPWNGVQLRGCERAALLQGCRIYMN